MCSERDKYSINKCLQLHSQAVYEMFSVAGLLGPVDKGITTPWNVSNCPQVEVGQHPTREDSSRIRFANLRYRGLT